MLKYKKYITRKDIQENPDALFIFGDNSDRSGYGGQAKEFRGEPNSVGITTKIHPSMKPDAFFTDKHFDKWRIENEDNYKKILNHLISGKDVFLPENDIGTGLAKLNETAPRIFEGIKAIENFFKFYRIDW